MQPTSAPYYASSSFNSFLPLALVWSAATNLMAPFCVKEEPLLAEDCLQPSAGSIAIVTGSNTGIGLETATALVERGYDVVLACRSRDKGEAAARSINEVAAAAADTSARYADAAMPGAATFLHPLDLSSLDSVREFAEQFSKRYKSLSILVNNAGINTTGKSADGYDLCFQTNFLGHFLLTNLLMPALLRAKNRRRGNDQVEAGRVVNLSSVMHHFVRADEARNGGKTRGSGSHNEQWWEGCIRHGVSDNTYAESKLAAALFTLELNRRYGKDGLRAVTANPGSVNSDIWRSLGKKKYVIGPIFSLVYLNSKQGARTSIAAAVGVLPKDARYLQPYWQPGFSTKTKAVADDACLRPSFQRAYGVQFPPFEMLGPCVGHAVTEVRLPDDGKGGQECSSALWRTCEKFSGL